MEDVTYLHMTTMFYEVKDTCPRTNGQPIWAVENVEEWEASHSPNEPVTRRAHFGGKLKDSTHLVAHVYPIGDGSMIQTSDKEKLFPTSHMLSWRLRRNTMPKGDPISVPIYIQKA